METLNFSKISQRIFEFSWRNGRDDQLVQIKLPHLDERRSQVWGDWGPMYNCQIQSPIEISYDEEAYNLNCQFLQINSPAFAKTREQLPFYVLIKDSYKGVQFKLFLNKDYELSKVAIFTTEKQIKIYEQFLEPLVQSQAM